MRLTGLAVELSPFSHEPPFLFSSPSSVTPCSIPSALCAMLHALCFNSLLLTTYFPLFPYALCPLPLALCTLLLPIIPILYPPIIPIFHHSSIPFFHHSSIPFFQHSTIPSFQHSIIPAAHPSFHYSIIPPFQYSNILFSLPYALCSLPSAPSPHIKTSTIFVKCSSKLCPNPQIHASYASHWHGS